MRLAFSFFDGPKGGTKIEIARGLMTLMMAVVVCAFAASFWSRIRVVLADGTLTLVHRRFAFWTTTTKWPLAGIRAVDLSFERATPVLSVRTRDVPSEDQGPPGVVALVGALRAQADQTVPLGCST